MSEITLPTLPSRAEPRNEAPSAPRKRAARKVKARKAKKRVEAPKSPNRPLENKNKLHAVLALTAHLRRAEMVTFAAVVETMEGMSRGARRRVLEALGRVYA
jgi:hypothetical protein